MKSDLDLAVETLFQKCPSLYGFSIEGVRTLARGRATTQIGSELLLADVTVLPWTGETPPETVLGEIAATLIELIDECPEAREALQGRTFARTLQ